MIDAEQIQQCLDWERIQQQEQEANQARLYLEIEEEKELERS